VTVRSAISPALRELAEEPDALLTDVPPPARRIITPRFTVVFAPSLTQVSVSRIRATAKDLDDTIAEVRRLVRDAGYLRCVWQIGPSCRPEGIGGRLLERGFAPATRPPYEPLFTSMALTSPPVISPGAAGIEARLVRDVDEYGEVIRIAMDAFNEPMEDAAAWIAAVPALWASQDGVHRYTHLALLDGSPVGFGFAVTARAGVLLGGSGVLASARGRGVYRALVAARWDEAVKLGKPGLVIHAGAMSRPILERCGFEAVCGIQVFDDLSFVDG
jgi:GNAT superfamily N-acetyltransferase